MTNIMRTPDLILSSDEPSGRYAATISENTVQAGYRGGKVWVRAPEGISFLILRWHGDFSPKCRIFGDVFERSYGDLEWRCILPERIMPWYCAAYDGERCEGFGVKVRPNAFCYWQIDGYGVSLTLDLRCGAGPALLEEEICAAELVYDVSGERPYAFLQGFCLKMSDSPVLPKQPVYGSNSWYYCYSASNRELIIKDAMLLQELTEGLENRPFAVVDCGWSETTDPEDPCAGTALADGNTAFGDMKTLADEVKGYGVRPGIWLRPLCLSCGKTVSEDLVLRRVNPGQYPCLDPSIPEALEIVGEDIRKAVDAWGYELIKIDFSTFDLLGKFHDHGELNCMGGGWSFKNKNKTSAQIIKDFYACIAQNAKDAVIIGCNCIGHLSSGYFHIYRIGDDTSGKVFERTRKMGVNTLAYRICQHKAFYDIDADCIGQAGDMPWELNKQWLELLAYSGTPLFVSIHPDRVTQEQKDTLRASYRAAARQDDVLEPLDFTDTACPDRYLINGREKTFKWFSDTGVTDFYI